MPTGTRPACGYVTFRSPRTSTSGRVEQGVPRCRGPPDAGHGSLSATGGGHLAAVWRGASRCRGVEVTEQRLADVAHVLDLLGGELVEQVDAHTLDMDGSRRLQGGEALVGEDGELTATVVGTDLAAHPAALLQP